MAVQPPARRPGSPPSRWVEGGEPRAVVDQVGRYRWRIVIRYTEAIDAVWDVRPIESSHAPDGYGWISWGSRERADRKAARILARFLRRSRYPREEHTVRG